MHFHWISSDIDFYCLIFGNNYFLLSTLFPGCYTQRRLQLNIFYSAVLFLLTMIEVNAMTKIPVTVIRHLFVLLWPEDAFSFSSTSFLFDLDSFSLSAYSSLSLSSHDSRSQREDKRKGLLLIWMWVIVSPTDTQSHWVLPLPSQKGVEDARRIRRENQRKMKWKRIKEQNGIE